MSKKFILLKILSFFSIVNSYNICIVGGSSGLGKELIYQGLENNIKILALTNNPNNIKIPYRGGGLSSKETNICLSSPNLKIDTYNNIDNYNFNNIVFTTGGQPFENDYSDELTKEILNKNLTNLKNIILLSADGVSDSLQKSNLGIKIMNNWYLKDVYYNKNQQETYLNKFIEDSNIDLEILRPKVLSYGENLINAKSRQELASEIINSVF